MHPRLAELFDYAAIQRRAVLDAVEAVPPASRDRWPADGVWSFSLNVLGANTFDIFQAQ